MMCLQYVYTHCSTTLQNIVKSEEIKQECCPG